MAYEKQTWVSGEIVTSQKMNHIEDGIEAAAQSGGGGNASSAFDFYSIIQDMESSSPYILESDVESLLDELPSLIDINEGNTSIFMNISHAEYEVDDNEQRVGVTSAYWDSVEFVHTTIRSICVKKYDCVSMVDTDISDGNINVSFEFVYDSSTDKYLLDTSNNS